MSTHVIKEWAVVLFFFLSLCLWFKIALADGQVYPGGETPVPKLTFHLSISHPPTPSQERGSCLGWPGPSFGGLGEEPEACLTGASCSKSSLGHLILPQRPRFLSSSPPH